MYLRLRDCSLRVGGGGGGGKEGIWAREGERSRALIPFPFPFNPGHAG